MSQGNHNLLGDAIIVGAGFSGMQQLYLLRKNGFKVHVLEKGSDVGGTWYWNRYPGARCDIESLQYSYYFLNELQQEWKWSESYASQPEILSYGQWVAEKLNLRPDITFNTEVTEARFNPDTCQWTVKTNTGLVYLCKFLIMATGCLSVPREQGYPGMKSFQGEILHTGKWPKEGVDFSGKKVAIIGTGSSAVQLIPKVAEEAASLTVFQRTANYLVPTNITRITDEYDQAYKKEYDAKRALANLFPFAAFSEKFNNFSVLSVSEEEREKILEEFWQYGNITFVFSFNDLFTNTEGNALVCDFIRKKIGEIVKDPIVAEKLKPKKSLLFGTKRACVGTNYYETFNRNNVELVDLKETPITEFTSSGIKTSEKSFDFDLIVLATGYDAITGPLTSIDIYNSEGKTIREMWKDEAPSSYIGFMAAGLPNFFMITGPGSISVLSNMMVSINHDTTWVANAISYLRENGYDSMEATVEAQNEWTAHIRTIVNYTVWGKGESWYGGYNIEGKPKGFIPYPGGYPAFAAKCSEVEKNGYSGFLLKKKN